MQQDKNNQEPKQEKFPPASTGNASNPSPQEDTAPAGNQLLDEKAEKYLREVAPIEDYPDEQEWEEANRIIEKEKEGKEDAS